MEGFRYVSSIMDPVKGEIIKEIENDKIKRNDPIMHDNIKKNLLFKELDFNMM
jgi:hypothetical protein